MYSISDLKRMSNYTQYWRKEYAGCDSWTETTASDFEFYRRDLIEVRILRKDWFEITVKEQWYNVDMSRWETSRRSKECGDAELLRSISHSFDVFEFDDYV